MMIMIIIITIIIVIIHCYYYYYYYWMGQLNCMSSRVCGAIYRSGELSLTSLIVTNQERLMLGSWTQVSVICMHQWAYLTLNYKLTAPLSWLTLIQPYWSDHELMDSFWGMSAHASHFRAILLGTAVWQISIIDIVGKYFFLLIYGWNIDCCILCLHGVNKLNISCCRTWMACWWVGMITCIVYRL